MMLSTTDCLIFWNYLALVWALSESIAFQAPAAIEKPMGAGSRNAIRLCPCRVDQNPCRVGWDKTTGKDSCRLVELRGFKLAHKRI